MPEAELLVVEDEPTLRELLAASLRFAGFRVCATATGTEALEAAARTRPDLVVLDVMLPDLDGFEVLRRLRAGGRHPPVLFLTARAGDEDKVTGLTGGADDYVTKPFKLEELIARIRAILRRAGAGAAQPVPGLELDPAGRRVRRDGGWISLSPTEFTLLRYLVEHAGQVLGRAQILHHVWRYDFGGDASIVESYISYLRRKVDNREPRLIHTVRGVGYVLRVPE
ncbi:response regulator transcription factor [Amycolatopsis nigrescens]|uniref:response regulator transcription factor n=1 Tax=Amycolatopsis nigrescens TaxID=381445 RepID=UPI00036B914A|nr:response regulator transcription factor [Amycolatopsis nigrescens]